jgi:alpha-1,3-mannosyltransferase
MFVIKRIYFNTMTRLAAKFSDKIIAVSSQDKRFMQKIANKKKIVLIGNGIDWGRLSKIKRSGNGKTLVYFGRIAKNKRIDRILHVVNGVKRKLPDVKLFLVGKDWGERKKLEGVVVRLGIKENVAFTGEVSDKKLHAILSKSDVFILASEYEGFGISVIEAMAAGLPVVVNNIETMKELIRNGRNGYIVNFKNHNKTARVVLKLLRNKSLREKIGESARYYSKKFDWSIVAANVEKIYETLFH